MLYTQQILSDYANDLRRAVIYLIYDISGQSKKVNFSQN